MTREEFGNVLDSQLQRIRDVLALKDEEYSSKDDQLKTQRAASQLQGISVPECVVGHMSKHTISLFSMVRDSKTYSPEQWDEKITDHMIYLLLLKAALIEEENV